MEDRLAGILLGTAVGDSVGLPAEGLSPRRRRRRLPGPWRQRLFFGRGLVSDDTEHAILVAQSLLAQPDDPTAFQRRLGKHLRWWFASLPPGIGKATARACIKLWLGFPTSRSGVFSAGNGPAMRSAILGGYFCDQPERINSFVRQSTRLAHTDPKAETGALAIALLAAWAFKHDAQGTADEYDLRFARWDRGRRRGMASGRRANADEPRSASLGRRFCNQPGTGAGRDRLHLPHGSRRRICRLSLRHATATFAPRWKRQLDCGGDADTVGAIAGRIGEASSTVGGNGIPRRMVTRNRRLAPVCRPAATDRRGNGGTTSALDFAAGRLAIFGPRSCREISFCF